MTRIRIAGLAVALALVTGAAPAAAVTNWTSFSTAQATGRGYFGAPQVHLAATSKLDPEALRFSVRGDSPLVSITWEATCWLEGNPAGHPVTSGSQDDVTLPFSKKITEITVKEWDYCNLDVTVTGHDPGRIVVKLQARYP